MERQVMEGLDTVVSRNMVGTRHSTATVAMVAMVAMVLVMQAGMVYRPDEKVVVVGSLGWEARRRWVLVVVCSVGRCWQTAWTVTAMAAMVAMMTMEGMVVGTLAEMMAAVVENRGLVFLA